MAIALPTGAAGPLTGDLIIDAATTGYKWTLGPDRTVDWSVSGGFAGEVWAAPLSVQQYATAMLETFSQFADIKFNFVGHFSTPTAAHLSGSEIDFYPSSSLAVFPTSSIWARAFFPTSASDTSYIGAAGDVVLNLNSPANSLSSYDPGSAGWFVFLHEIGHALGLKHPFDDGGTGRPTVAELGLPELDIDWATIMAYGDDFNYNLREYDPATPMLLDVLALQHLYGPNLKTNAGNETYSLTAQDRYASIWDAGGLDQVTAAGSDRGWEIYLPDEKLSSLSPVSVGYAMPLADTQGPSPHSFFWLLGEVENATGSAFADDIYGGVLANYLQGMGGSDYIDGWDGDDRVDGGAGDDVVYGGLGNDTLSDPVGWNYLRGEEGNDAVTGGADHDDINGNMGDDTVAGGAGDDWVLGGGDNDSLQGGDGADILNGNLGADICDGGAGADSVRGGQGHDLLAGGAGNDWMTGDLGDDTVSGGAGSDSFRAFSGGGMDRITDFNIAEGDRVLLDAGTTRTVAQVGADVVISMGVGSQTTLVGVQLVNLSGAWLVEA